MRSEGWIKYHKWQIYLKPQVLLFTGRNFLNWKFRIIQLWPRILPIRNAEHRQNPVTVRGHGEPVYCNGKGMDVGGYKFEKNICCQCDHGHPFCFIKFLCQKGHWLCPDLFCDCLSCFERDLCTHFRDLSFFSIWSRIIFFVMFYPVLSHPVV